MSKKIPKIFYFQTVPVKLWNAVEIDSFREELALNPVVGGLKDIPLKNLTYFYQYFGINKVISSLNNLRIAGNKKAENIYTGVIDNITELYEYTARYCMFLLTRLCHVPYYTKDYTTWKDLGAGDKTYNNVNTPDDAMLMLKPTILAMLGTIDMILEETFPKEVLAKISRIDVDKQMTEMKEAFL